MANAAVFFDRDGTLIRDPGYLNHPDQVQLLDGAAEALQEFQQLGYQTVVVSNQSGVARGIVSVEMLERIHDRLRELLAVKGATLDAIYYCPYHPDGTVPEFRKDSDWRKPRPGMLLAAATEMDLDLSRSWMIGDSDRDVRAGRSAGCKTILITTTPAGSGGASETRPPLSAPTSKPDFVAVNMREAVNIIKRHHRTLGDPHAVMASQTPEPSETQDLAAKSAEILSMVQEYATEEPAEPAPPSAAAPGETTSRTDQLLTNILEHLRRRRDDETNSEFSLMRLLAGVVQVFVFFCLLLVVWFLMGARRQDTNAFLALGFAAVLQLMALTFYIMHGRR
jgi:D-glycero-D-manno-heptose 1,7-bisphosphate phosphatase